MLEPVKIMSGQRLERQRAVLKEFRMKCEETHKISDRWRERAWILDECEIHQKVERGAASGSLDRLVRRFCVAAHLTCEKLRYGLNP